MSSAEILIGRRRWLTLVAMTGSLSMILVDVTVVGVSLPSISADTGVGTTGADWIVNSYILTMASLAAIGGRLGDLLGKRTSFVLGVIIFALSSAACGFAGSGAALVIGRICQGVGAALMQPASSALVISAFPGGERGKAMGVYIGIPMLFLAAGPALGGAICQYLTWRWVFWVNLPIAVGTLVLTAIARPPSPKAARTPADWAGGILLLLGLPSFVFALQDAPKRGFTDPLVVGCGIAGAVLLGLFIRRQWQHPHPLLRLRLFADRRLLADALLILLMQAGMTGCAVFGPQFLQDVVRFRPFESGLAMLPLFVPILVLVHVAGRTYDRLGVRAPARAGTALALVGFAIQAISIASSAYLPFAVGSFVLGSGIAFIMSPATTDALSRSDESERAQVSGLLITFRQLGGALGVAVVSAAVARQLSPPAPLAQAISAGYWVATIASALAVLVAWLMIPGRETGEIRMVDRQE